MYIWVMNMSIIIFLFYFGKSFRNSKLAVIFCKIIIFSINLDDRVIHSKCILTDDNLTSIGSINMDNRSFYHHFECGVLVYDSSIIAEVKYDMLSTMKESEEITLDWCKEHMSRITLVDAFLRLLSPLL